MDDFSQFSRSELKLDYDEICANINKLAENDGVSFSTDRRLREYYKNGKPLIWINRLGVYHRADTLMAALSMAGVYGLDTDMLRLEQIGSDLSRMKALDFSSADDGINVVIARLEYNLTRAYLRYSVGVRFGFVNPDYHYNNIEKYSVDSVRVRFRQLSDLRTEKPDEAFYEHALSVAFNDSIAEFLTSIHPNNELYGRLIKRLNDEKLTSEQRLKTICNIERCRWRLKKMEGQEEVLKKYVEVNIPSFSLRAIGQDSILTMRVICGAIKTKTPVLKGMIMRMDVNPQWIVPKSISTDYIGRSEYMHRLGMFVYDKRNKRKLPPEEASYSKVMNGEQYLIQAGGPKNSLGRIIFRFDNNFSVFLHDTSSPWLFKRDNRALSHGCVRIEKPYDLALFMLDERDEELEDKIKYSMALKCVNDKDSFANYDVDKKRLVNSVKVKPEIPLFIRYYTVYFDERGQLAEYKDIYGYDKALAERLKPFVK